MDPMSHTQPGKSARFAPGTSGGGATREMFEVVPEANLDFAFYKNRADFGDEHGGGGELYGRPLDLVSERSHTPASFVTEGSGGESRSSSPAPSLLRKQRPGDMSYPTAWRADGVYDTADIGGGRRRDRGHLYIHSNDSESGRQLLAEPQPVGVVDEGRAEPYSLDRWRTGGSGYVGVPGTIGDEEPLEYDAYRHRDL